MPRAKPEQAEQIIPKLREVGVELGRGKTVAEAVKTLYIEPGSPWGNGYVDSFNSKLRDELSKRESFDTGLEAKVLVERWRQNYNTIRPHSALGYRPPVPEARQPCAVASATPRQLHKAGLIEGENLT